MMFTYYLFEIMVDYGMMYTVSLASRPFISDDRT